MIEFSAFYYDGKTSARTAVSVRGLAQSLHITGADLNLEVALAAVQVDARIGNVRRTLELPGGARLQTDDHAALDALFPRANRLETWAQGLERQWSYSRAFETEADTFAFERLKSIGLSPVYFAEFMELLDQHQQARAAARKGAPDGKTAATPHALDYLSTHPATAERIQRARDYR